MCEILADGLSASGAVWNSRWKGGGRSGSRHSYVVRMKVRDAEGSGRGSVVCSFLMGASISNSGLAMVYVSGLAGAHNPIAVIAGSYTRACLFKLKVLQQLYAICIFWVLL